MDNQGHKKVLQEEAKTIRKSFEKERTKQSENEYEVNKNMFESIKHDSKISLLLTKNDRIQK